MYKKIINIKNIFQTNINNNNHTKIQIIKIQEEQYIERIFVLQTMLMNYLILKKKVLCALNLLCLLINLNMRIGVV